MCTFLQDFCDQCLDKWNYHKIPIISKLLSVTLNSNFWSKSQNSVFTFCLHNRESLKSAEISWFRSDLEGRMSSILKAASHKAVPFAHSLMYFPFLFFFFSLCLSRSFFLEISFKRGDRRPKQRLPLPRVSCYAAILRANATKTTFSMLPSCV